ncbi:MAG TPA: phospholipase D-like domain-containing protein [Myxococcota bacterium]|nr:phospholipase D-like domain-containing protein [Myxococcota bacterium]
MRVDVRSAPAAGLPDGRQAAHRHLSALTGPLARLDPASARAVADLVHVLYEGREHFLSPAVARAQAGTLLAGLQTRRTQVPAPTAKALAQVEGTLRSWIEAGLGPTPAAPEPSGRPLLEAVAREAASTDRLATLAPHGVLTHGNAMLGPVLHTGDEVWAAAARLITRAHTSVSLHTWALYPGSESAKHIMGGLAHLQARQAICRAAGEQRSPVRVRIVLGSLTWGHRAGTGGSAPIDVAWAAALRAAPFSAAPPSAFHYGIFPFPIDPALLDVRFHALRHTWRGATHTKTLLVDDDVALLTSANVKGNHHRASTGGAPFHDFGWVVAGPCVAQALRPDFEFHLKRSEQRGSNTEQAPLSDADVHAIARYVETALAPAPLDPPQQGVLEDKLDALAADLDALGRGALSRPPMAVVTLAKAPVDTLYTRATESPMSRGLLAAMASARHRIEVNNCNLGAAAFLEGIKAALQRGCEVRILCSERYNRLVYAFPPRANRDIYDGLATWAARVRPPGVLRLRWHPDGHGDDIAYRASHTKAMFIDGGALAVVCSANNDEQSWRYAGELNLCTDDPHAAGALRQALFAAFWEEGRPSFDASALELQPTERSRGERLKAQLGAVTALFSFAPPTPSQRVAAGFNAALASRRTADKVAYIAGFNRDHAPHLVTEDAALERYLRKHIRLALPPGTPIAFNITHDLHRRPVADYGRTYVRTANFASKISGGRATLLTSEDKTADGGPTRAIVCLEGVTFRPDAVYAQAGMPRGLRAAVDPRGVGHAAAEDCVPVVATWIRDCLARGQRATLAGFSQGGTLAVAAWSALSFEERAAVRLRTFGAPAFWTDLGAVSEGEDVRHLRTRGDWVTKVGRHHLGGEVVKLPGASPLAPWVNHLITPLSSQELDGRAASHSAPTPGRKATSASLERSRRLLGVTSDLGKYLAS